MLGKYDFSKENIEKIYDFFIPLLESIKINTTYFIKILEGYCLKTNKIKEFYNKLLNISYFDEFQEVRDEFNIYFKELELEILKKEKYKTFNNKLVIFLYPIQIKETIKLIDFLIKTSYENINLSNKQVLTIKEIIVICNEKIAYLIDEIKGIYLANNLKISSKFSEIIFNFNQKEDINLLEIKIENLSFELEKMSLEEDKVIDIYDNNFSFLWSIFVKIQKISTYFSVISILNEFIDQL